MNATDPDRPPRPSASAGHRAGADRTAEFRPDGRDPTAPALAPADPHRETP